MQDRTTETPEPTDERAVMRAFSLYPRQVAIIEDFAKRDRRSLSNALQVILEQWGEQEQAQQ